MSFDPETRLQEWHDIVFNRDTARLGDFLADDIAFYSPVLWKPKQGKMAAFLILSTAMQVFEDFTYHRQWLNGDQWALEFSARVGELSLQGIDLMQFNEAGQIVNFEVMVRPLNGVQVLGAEMARRLAEQGIQF